jgi:hypothetical protein
MLRAMIGWRRFHYDFCEIGLKKFEISFFLRKPFLVFGKASEAKRKEGVRCLRVSHGMIVHNDSIAFNEDFSTGQGQTGCFVLIDKEWNSSFVTLDMDKYQAHLK